MACLKWQSHSELGRPSQLNVNKMFLSVPMSSAYATNLQGTNFKNFSRVAKVFY